MIACLLPARNAERDLPEWLGCVHGFADAVVALDDGSTDSTRQILEADPLVVRVLTEDPRDDHAGWDDARNRRRLLEAAGELEPDWIVFLDADERIDADDAAALRRFLETEALRGCAYGLALFRDWGEDRIEPSPTFVYRCFAWQPALELSDERLHLIPVPRSIPSGAWIPTTIRARHLHSDRRAEERSRRYAEADPAGEWDRGQPGPDPAPRIDWAPRPAALPALVPGGLGTEAYFQRSAAKPRLACLVPVRNEEETLPGFLESASSFADAVIALDDSSTDSSAEILAASPLVETVLANPRRPGYAGWDDRENRRRLIEAARGRGFDWLLFLDADERIDEGDAKALRGLVETIADPARAYGFRTFRMTGEDTYDRAELWVYRLFAASLPGDLPEGRLHFVPVPEAEERAPREPTTIRIQHFGSLDDERRSARSEKYREADPGLDFQASYENLTERVGPPLRWLERPEGFPLLATSDPMSGAALDLTALSPEPEGPLLSAVVIARDDRARITRAVRAVVDQRCSAEFEVIVAASGSDGTADLVRAEFPSVRVVDVPEPGLPGMARNAGLAAARGVYVTFPGSHVELPSGSLEARIAAHELGWPMVSGPLINGTRTRAGWASYFLDGSSALPGRDAGALGAAPARASYSRELLTRVGGFPEQLRAGEDTVVNEDLWSRGYECFHEPGAATIHHSPCATVPALLAHHFGRGRAMGRIVRAGGPARGRLRYSFDYARSRVRGTAARVRRDGAGLESEYARARPLVAVAATASGLGVLAEPLRPGGARPIR